MTHTNPDTKSFYSARSVSWIKLAVTMFDGEKIRIIESMPEGDAIVVIWLKLLTMAGKTNDDGLVYLSEGIPYSEDDLAVIFNKPVTTVQLGLTMLKRYGLIEADDAGIRILNWEEQQNTDALERIRENQRIASAKYRQRQKDTKLFTQGKDASYDASYNVITQNKSKNKREKKKDITTNRLPADSRKPKGNILLLKENATLNTPPSFGGGADATGHDSNATGCNWTQQTLQAEGVGL